MQNCDDDRLCMKKAICACGVNVSVRVEGSNGSLPSTTPKGSLNYTARHRVRDSAGSP